MILMLPDETESLCSAVPPHLLDGLRRYALHHLPTGGFLRACLENDLLCAVVRAEDVAYLPAVVKWIHNCAPSQCHGSPEMVKAWLAEKPAAIQRAAAEVTGK